MDKQTEFLMIEAAADGNEKATNPKVMGIAYSGGKMNLPGWKHPVVVDLSGLAIPANVPLLTNHENRTAARVGQVAAKIEDGVLMIEGEITSASGTASGIVEQAKAGADWQLSIGAEVTASEFVKAGSREINGQTHEAPFYHVKTATLREVSVVAVGADVQTKMHVAAMFNLTGELTAENQSTNSKETAMDNENKNDKSTNSETKPIETVTAEADITAKAIADERKRVEAITQICMGEHDAIQVKAISEGWTTERASAAVLQAIRDARPMADVNIAVKPQADSRTKRNTLEAALCMRVGLSGDDLLASYGEQVVDSADRIRGKSLPDVLAECVRLEGMAVPDGDTGLIQAAFSTVSLPGILSNVANKRMLKAFESQPLIAPKLCSVGDLNDFKENQRFRLTDVGDLEPVAADGEIKDGSVREDKATNQLDTYGKKFVLTRKMIINDDLGAFMKFPTSMGNRAARLIDQLFFQRLLSNPTQGDGKKLFHTGHKNLLTGADSELNHESLSLAISMYLDQTDADGQPISVEPKFLLVPTGLKHDAIRLTRGSQLIVSGGDATSGASPTLMPALNALADENLTVISSPYLTNANYTGNSESGWYLFGDPNQVDTFEIGYLKGKRTPTIEKGNTDFNTLGMWFRVYFDLGIREQDWRGLLKSDGE
jgi:phage head maturation protease